MKSTDEKGCFKIITMICFGVMLVSAGMIYSGIPVKAPSKLKGRILLTVRGKKFS